LCRVERDSRCGLPTTARGVLRIPEHFLRVWQIAQRPHDQQRRGFLQCIAGSQGCRLRARQCVWRSAGAADFLYLPGRAVGARPAALPGIHCRAEMMPNVALLRGAGLALLLAMLAACSSQADIAEVRAAIGDAPVVLLSTSTCGYCKKLRADLAAWGVDYVDLDVESNDDGWRAYDLVNG